MTEIEQRKSIAIYPETHTQLRKVQEQMSLELGITLNLRQTFELLIKNYLEKEYGRSKNVSALEK